MPEQGVVPAELVGVRRRSAKDLAEPGGKVRDMIGIRGRAEVVGQDGVLQAATVLRVGEAQESFLAAHEVIDGASFGHESAPSPYRIEMSRIQDTDHVDRVRAQWAEVWPELDTAPIDVVARLGRIAYYFDQRHQAFFAAHDLTRADWDILASLRRVGPPYRLSPTELYQALMRSSGGMTHRLGVLERKGLVRRLDDPHDRRGRLVALTRRGKGLVDRVAGEHLDNERDMLAGLTQRQRSELVKLLRILASFLEQPS